MIKAKVKTINISLSSELVKQIDRKAGEEFRSRSELIREATLSYIQTKSNWEVLQNDLSLRAKKLKIKNEDEIEKLVDSMRK